VLSVCCSLIDELNEGRSTANSHEYTKMIQFVEFKVISQTVRTWNARIVDCGALTYGFSAPAW
jgi:hypothetical protein